MREFERLKQTSQVNLANCNLSLSEKNELERMREALDKALQVKTTCIITNEHVFNVFFFF